MKHITVKLFAHYRQNKFSVKEFTYNDDFKIENIINDIGIDIDKYPIGIILVNGKHVDENYVVNDGDVLSIFPKVGGG
jgi:molybdopterin converting factor small subunit